MKCAVDLHIHSALSPCASNDMTPNNIVNMAVLKRLDVIAVTDHNSADNVEAVLKCAKQANILAIPGMEIETREEVHLVCYLPNLEKLMEVHSIVSKALPLIRNREDIFGEQLVMDENDNIKRCEGQLLLTATKLSIQEVINIVSGLGGVVIPAHVDRQAYSIISNLGIIPEDSRIKYLEVSKHCNLMEFFKKNNLGDKYMFIKSSDAHLLGDILERDFFVEIENLNITNLVQVFSNKTNL